MCADNVVIDAVNPIGAKKGQFVQFNIPDAGMGVKGIVCFGVPLLLIIVCGIIGYVLGGQVKAAPEMTAFAGMIIGGIIGCLILKGYEKKINNNQNKATITGIIA